MPAAFEVQIGEVGVADVTQLPEQLQGAAFKGGQHLKGVWGGGGQVIGHALLMDRVTLCISMLPRSLSSCRGRHSEGEGVGEVRHDNARGMQATCD